VPELPEVEVTRRKIEHALIGRTVTVVTTTPNSYFFITPPDTLERLLPGQSATRLERLGKYLVASFDSGDRLLLHLGMTGQLFVHGASSVRLLSATGGGSLTPEGQLAAFEADEHTHLQLAFRDGGPRVLFRDVRKFGKVQLLRPGEAATRLEKLGVDALAATAGDLLRATRGRRLVIKTLLLDQSVLAGVGNIYADEALFLAGVRPTRRAARVTRNDADRIVTALQQVLRRSIDTGGASINDYVQPDGEDGTYQDERRVYGRAGEPCPNCRTPILRRVIGQRSSHYCRRCQH
jgi:formamidopyrimidine-DNA glycosylase